MAAGHWFDMEVCKARTSRKNHISTFVKLVIRSENTYLRIN